MRKCCLVGKDVVEKRVNHEAFKSTMLKIWKIVIVDVVFRSPNSFASPSSLSSATKKGKGGFGDLRGHSDA